MDYKECFVYGRNIRFYDENHIEMEYRNIKDNWKQKQVILNLIVPKTF
jgi:hypothetical protein